MFRMMNDTSHMFEFNLIGKILQDNSIYTTLRIYREERKKVNLDA